MTYWDIHSSTISVLLVLLLERTFLTCRVPNLQVDFSTSDINYTHQSMNKQAQTLCQRPSDVPECRALFGSLDLVVLTCYHYQQHVIISCQVPINKCMHKMKCSIAIHQISFANQRTTQELCNMSTYPVPCHN